MNGPRKALAYCERWVDVTAHANAPTCPDCAAMRAEDERHTPDSILGIVESGR